MMSEFDEETLKDEIDRFEREREAPGPRRYVKPRPPKDPAQVYSIRIPVDRLEQLRILADREGKRPTTMMREWVLERLDLELARSGLLPIDRIPIAADLVRKELGLDFGVERYFMEKIRSSFHVNVGSNVVFSGYDEEDLELPLPFSVEERLRQ